MQTRGLRITRLVVWYSTPTLTPGEEMREVGQSSVVRFGVFELDLRAGELQGNGQRTRLHEQPLQILLLLLEHPGQVVLREEIRQRLWPNDTVVEFDHSINAAIKKLRRALDDAPEEPHYVETIPRRGYRLKVPVEWVDVAPGAQPGSVDLSLKSAAFAQGKAAELENNSALPSVTAEGLIGKRVSHYRVVEILGGGGMGVVYKAEDIKLGRGAALKFLPEELAAHPRALERFEREARAASALNHPNICTVYEFGEHEGQPFIAMELLEGQTLARLVAGKPLTMDRLLDLSIQTADALAAAHQKGIIHRDIKPANLFVTNRGDVKILDFGLAKLSESVEAAPSGVEQGNGDGAGGTRPLGAAIAPEALAADSNITKTGVAMGTAPYMSPEQVRGEKLDARTDLFSFGLVLYEMATGRVAFAGETFAEVHDAIVNRTPAPVRQLNADIPAKLEGIINKALEKDHELRYQSAGDLLADLKGLKTDADSEHHRARRRASLMIAAAVLVLAAGASLAWLLMRDGNVQGKPVERQITANLPENFVTAAAISPDGKYIAYDDQTGLYLRSVDSGETRPVSLPTSLRKRMETLEWFPDGGKLLAEVAGSLATDVDVWVITTLGEEAPRLLYRHAGHPAISQDGQLIAFVGANVQGQVESSAVLVGGINGEPPRQLATAAQNESLASPVWSPDGRWIAYARISPLLDTSYTGLIEVRPAGGGPAKTLVSQASLPPSSSPCNRLADPCLRWSPDWRLVFAVNQATPSSAESSLWEVPVQPRTGEAAARPKSLTQSGELTLDWFGLTRPTITADGKRLCFLKNYSWGDVYVGDIAPGGLSIKPARRFSLDSRGSYANSWTRDSKAIILHSARSGKSEIFKQGLNEHVAEPVARSSVDCDIPVLSPEGSWILYRESTPAPPGAARSVSRLMRRPAAGGSPEMVLEEPGDRWWYYRCPLKPAASCVLSRYEGKDFVFYALDPVRGIGKQLGKIEVSPSLAAMWDISPDGSRVALVGGYDMDVGKIEVLTFGDRDWHEVPVDPGWGILQSISWTVDGKGFFVTGWPPSLLHVTATGKVSPLLRNTAQWMWGPLPSPDGKHLAFMANTYDANVWMLENF
jgi:eukaryotic-like serine/threonine-protein kinase